MHPSEEENTIHKESSKRRNSEQEFWESIKEKKQRVEQVVSGLTPTDRESVGDNVSSTTDVKEEHAEKDNGNMDRNTENTFVDVVTTSDEDIKPSIAVITSDNLLKPKYSAAFSVRTYPTNHGEASKFHPQVVTCESGTTYSQRPYFPVSRENGIMVKNKLQIKSEMVRVPRDNKTPFLIYTPPPLKPHKPTSHVIGNPKNVLPTLEPATNIRVLNPHTVHKMIPTKLSPKGNKEFSWNTRESPSPLHRETMKLLSPQSTKVDVTKWGAEDVHTKVDVMKWGADDVYSYLLSTQCAAYAPLLNEQEIDGCALLHLADETMITRLLGVKMGPALKLNAIIKHLKERRDMSSS